MLNVEIKARTNNAEKAEKILLDLGAKYAGLDHQKDIYYQVAKGRLKLRIGNIENSLIFYRRENQKGAKTSYFEIARLAHNSGIENVLNTALGVKIIVEKKRKIFYIDNVKFHIDQLDNLGDFIEIEAMDMNGQFTKSELQESCLSYMKKLKIANKDLVANSYADLILSQLG